MYSRVCVCVFACVYLCVCVCVLLLLEKINLVNETDGNKRTPERGRRSEKRDDGRAARKEGGDRQQIERKREREGER